MVLGQYARSKALQGERAIRLEPGVCGIVLMLYATRVGCAKHAADSGFAFGDPYELWLLRTGC